ncbi:unnamed protein product [Durusdinium trenchii]|uniref:Vacuolar protein sorting-associated protein 54 N-terminal domain-containing protein n=1 Tax=Durusdinium trenchii TaxID=1381693 RepID=A0ABP0RLY5_9DINO
MSLIGGPEGYLLDSTSIRLLRLTWWRGSRVGRAKTKKAASDVVEAQGSLVSAGILRGSMRITSVPQRDPTGTGKRGRERVEARRTDIRFFGHFARRQHQRRERLKELLSLLEDLQGVVEIDARLRESIDEDRYAEAILQHSVLRDALASAQYRRFPGVVGLHQSMANNLTLVQQKLSERLRACTVSADFDPDSYEEVLKAYSLLASDQAVSVGKELLRHVSEFIVAVSRQCMLAFSARNESPDWHKRAQLRELCKSMALPQWPLDLLEILFHREGC